MPPYNQSREPTGAGHAVLVGRLGDGAQGGFVHKRPDGVVHNRNGRRLDA